MPGAWVYAFYEDKKGDFWIGTNKGLYCYNESRGSYKKYTVEDGLPDNVICGILPGSSGEIWISTTGGLSCFNTTSGTFRNFFKNDGLQGNNFSIGAVFKDGENLFFGGTGGLTFFNPNNIKTNTYEPPVLITKVRLDKKEINTIGDPSSVNLSYDEAASIVFNFTALNFINPAKNRFKYKLQGFDDSWRDSEGARFATYTNLDPGKYVFMVQASNNDNIWNPESARLTVVINPPFWKTSWAYLLYFLILAGLLYLIFRYFALKIRYGKDLEIERLKREKTEELTKLKSDFFTTVSHELNTPITLILAPLQEMKSLEKYDRRLVNIAWNNSRRLQKLVKDLLDFQKADSKTESLLLAKSDLVSFLSALTDNFKVLYENKGLSLIFTSSLRKMEIVIDLEKMEKVFYNLLSNAYKYTPENGKVEVFLDTLSPEGIEWEKPEIPSVYIRVKDTGPGIPQEAQGLLFEKYYRVKKTGSEKLTESTGYGIGLYLVKTFLELHQGEVKVVSNPGEGSAFWVKVPVNMTGNSFETAYSDYALNLDLAEIAENKEQNEEEEEKRNHKPTVLIVEDNAEIMSLLDQLLRDDYQVLKVSDGVKALKVISQKMPDLILSDIMMPGMDGIELCDKVKRDAFTSHIPVVLLTALGTDEYRLKGLERGADDYISKPFNPLVLKRRVYNLIQSRILLQKKFLTDNNLPLSEVTTSSSDEDLLKKAIETVELNMENPEFSVEVFAKELNMSESSIYRKLKGLVNQSSNQFIRTVRLKKAAQLLELEEYNVSDVCYRVGFNDVKYFRECFKKQFGESPTDYIKRKEINNTSA